MDREIERDINVEMGSSSSIQEKKEARMKGTTRAKSPKCTLHVILPAVR